MSRTNPYARTYASFKKQTKGHELHVLHEDGLYRHLRVQAPGTRMWGWDITTWPGHLATSGDISAGYVFSREPDMLEFFAHAGVSQNYYSDGAPCIDVRYWAEKIQGPAARTTEVYSADAFLAELSEHLEEHEEFGLTAEAFRDRQMSLLERIDQMRRRYAHNRDLPTVAERLALHWGNALSTAELFDYSDLSQAHIDMLDEEFALYDDAGRVMPDLFELASCGVPALIPSSVRAEILSDARDASEHQISAQAWLAENETRIGASDTWEWNLTEYDTSILFACYAIHLTTQLYRAASDQTRTPQ